MPASGPPLQSLVKYDVPSLLTTKEKKGAKGGADPAKGGTDPPSPSAGATPPIKL